MPLAQPALFVSHGAPTLLIERDSSARRALSGLGHRLDQEFGRPRAVLAVSAHWPTLTPTLATSPRPATLHDYHGFPEELYRLSYPAPGAPELVDSLAPLLAAAGLDLAVDPTRGLDHGAWVPMMAMYPEADIPIAQLSMQPRRDAAAHIALGRALAPLRAAGVLILASGGAVHNLRAYRQDDGPAPPWATAFADWLGRTLAAGDVEAIAQWKTRSPDAAQAHPTDEHFLPLAVALGAAGPNPRATPPHAGFEHGGLGMHAWVFTGA